MKLLFFMDQINMFQSNCGRRDIVLKCLLCRQDLSCGKFVSTKEMSGKLFNCYTVILFNFHKKKKKIMSMTSFLLLNESLLSSNLLFKLNLNKKKLEEILSLR